MINCIIVDDESYATDTLSDYINKSGMLNLLHTFNSATAALQVILNGPAPDLVFLDIDMPELTGLELARLIPANVGVVYVTAHSGYALDAFDTNVYDFLLKPVSFAKFMRTVQKVNLMLEQKSPELTVSQDHFFINPGVKNKLIKINYPDIIYIEGLKNYVVIHTIASGKHVTYLTMKEIAEALPDDRFLRTHKSYVINLDLLQSVEGNMVVMPDRRSLPLGAAYKDTLMRFIQKRTVVSRR